MKAGTEALVLANELMMGLEALKTCPLDIGNSNLLQAQSVIQYADVPCIVTASMDKKADYKCTLISILVHP